MRYRVRITKNDDIIDRYRWYLQRQESDDGRWNEVVRGYALTPLWARYFARRWIKKREQKMRERRRERTVELDRQRIPLRRRIHRG